MPKILQNILIVICIGIIGACIQKLQSHIFMFSMYSTAVFGIYFPAGARLIAVLMFQKLGAVGIFVGWALIGLFGNERGLTQCLYIGVSAGLSAYLAYWLWVKMFRVADDLRGLNAKNLVYLALIAALITTPFRMMYFHWYGLPISLTILIISFVGDLIGSLITLLLIKFLYYVYLQWQSNRSQ